jgi:nicotinate phosphoribosyltransferase
VQIGTVPALAVGKSFANRMPTNALSTDLYQLTMMAGYFQTGRHARPATFELFVRRLPKHRSCLIAAGLEQALHYFETLRFSADEVAFVGEQPAFARIDAAFFDYLRAFRFTGEVWAMREGTPFFPNEPILRVTAPLAEAQLVETAVLAIINFQTSIASKAHRVVQAAAGTRVIEFGARRAHGLDAALYAARAAYLAGVDATSFVEAGRQFGIPLSGTMAHSWVLAAANELEAFTSYAGVFDGQTVLLLDTFDVESALRTAIEAGIRPTGVRIDSGDLLALSRRARALLDNAGLNATQIILSGDLDEWKIHELVRAHAPVGTYAVGTALATSDDAPALGGVYKLVEIDVGAGIRSVMKRSAGKATWPGRKQVWRDVEGGVAKRDVVALSGEPSVPGRMPLLDVVMRNGQRVAPPAAVADLRQRRAEMVAMMPRALGELSASVGYDVERSDALNRALTG